MSEEERCRWDQRYREGTYRASTEPTPLLVEWLPALPRGRALDLATGRGRNALFLARHGFQVDAVDISAEALRLARASAREQRVAVQWVAADLDDYPLPAGAYDVIVVARYLNRELVPGIIDSLKPQGHLLYEHHLVTDQEVAGPPDPRHRLRPNELLRLFGGLRALFYHEGLTHRSDGSAAALARLVACKDGCGP